MVERSRVVFDSAGIECVGYHYRPDGAAGTLPCVVMGHGFTGTQEGSLRENAVEFARAGMAVLSFDYRSFGESGGEPRQVIAIHGQHQDWHAAIACARNLPGVDPDRIGLWGSSLGGGHVLVVAAADPKVAAVIAQVPFTFGFPRNSDAHAPADARRLFKLALADWLAGRRGRSRRYLPAVGHRGDLAVMASDNAWRVIQVLDGGTWRNEVAPGVIIDMAFWYRPGRSAGKIRCPLLLALAEHDKETPVSMARKVAERAPFGEMRRYPCTHFDFYRPEIRPVIVRDQVSFLQTHLVGLGI